MFESRDSGPKRLKGGSESSFSLFFFHYGVDYLKSRCRKENRVLNQLPDELKPSDSEREEKTALSPSKVPPSRRPVPVVETMTATQVIRRAQVRLERVLLGSVLGFVTFVGVAIYFSEGQVLDAFIETIRAVESPDHKSSKNRAINCQHPKNKSLPYCQDRLGEIEETWRGIMRHQRGESPPFGLTNGR